MLNINSNIKIICLLPKICFQISSYTSQVAAWRCFQIDWLTWKYRKPHSQTESSEHDNAGRSTAVFYVEKRNINWKEAIEKIPKYPLEHILTSCYLFTREYHFINVSLCKNNIDRKLGNPIKILSAWGKIMKNNQDLSSIFYLQRKIYLQIDRDRYQIYRYEWKARDCKIPWELISISASLHCKCIRLSAESPDCRDLLKVSSLHVIQYASWSTRLLIDSFIQEFSKIIIFFSNVT